MKAHIYHFLSDTVFAELYKVLCFMETNLRNQSYNNNFAAGWDGILELPNHGLTICFDTEKAKVVKEYL